jgi:hypothetical protein
MITSCSSTSIRTKRKMNRNRMKNMELKRSLSSSCSRGTLTRTGIRLSLNRVRSLMIVSLSKTYRMESKLAIRDREYSLLTGAYYLI